MSPGRVLPCSRRYQLAWLLAQTRFQRPSTSRTVCCSLHWRRQCPRSRPRQSSHGVALRPSGGGLPSTHHRSLRRWRAGGGLRPRRRAARLGCCPPLPPVRRERRQELQNEGSGGAVHLLRCVACNTGSRNRPGPTCVVARRFDGIVEPTAGGDGADDRNTRRIDTKHDTRAGDARPVLLKDGR